MSLSTRHKCEVNAVRSTKRLHYNVKHVDRNVRLLRSKEQTNKTSKFYVVEEILLISDQSIKTTFPLMMQSNIN